MAGRADDDRNQTQGRKANAAQPLDAADDNKGAERYPKVSMDVSVEEPGEERCFADKNPQPRQGAGDTAPPVSTNEGRLGPGGDPAEGKP